MLTYPKNYDPNDEINKTSNSLNLTPSTYPNYGLYHQYDHLLDSYPKIIYCEIERQIMYSDVITRRYCLNKNFLILQKGLLQINLSITKANTTSIGNIACLAFYNGLDREWRKLYTKTINSLKESLL